VSSFAIENSQKKTAENITVSKVKVYRLIIMHPPLLESEKIVFLLITSPQKKSQFLIQQANNGMQDENY